MYATSLFLALALLVCETKEEVCRVVACVDPQWLQGLEDSMDRVVMGVGLEME